MLNAMSILANIDIAGHLEFLLHLNEPVLPRFWLYE